MDQLVRDPFDIPITTDERWVSVRFNHYNKEAIEWAEEEFGNGFFNFGPKFFFADEQHMVMFMLRWS